MNKWGAAPSVGITGGKAARARRAEGGRRRDAELAGIYAEGR